MSGRTLKHDLLQQLVVARIALESYLAMRKAKGYMSVSESEHLRDNLLNICHQYRDAALALQLSLTEEEREALRHVFEAMSSMAVCLMSGRRDCPQYITVDAIKLEAGLTQLSCSLSELTDRHKAVEA